jgi:hypothetical protein
MTYCLGMLLERGADHDRRHAAPMPASTTFSSYRKLPLPDRRARPHHLRRLGGQSLDHPDDHQPAARGLRTTGTDSASSRTIADPTVDVPRRPAGRRGGADRQRTVGKALASIQISGASSILLGGRIGDTPPPCT